MRSLLSPDALTARPLLAALLTGRSWHISALQRVGYARKGEKETHLFFRAVAIEPLSIVNKCIPFNVIEVDSSVQSSKSCNFYPHLEVELASSS